MKSNEFKTTSKNGAFEYTIDALPRGFGFEVTKTRIATGGYCSYAKFAHYDQATECCKRAVA